MIEKVRVATFIVDDREAALIFPDIKNEADMTTLLVGQDSIFCEWCTDYFEHEWRSSKPFDMKRITVVEY